MNPNYAQRIYLIFAAIHMEQRRTRHSQFGFSLIQTSIILLIASLVLVSTLPGHRAGDTNQKILDTIAHMNKIEDGMQRFMSLTGRRPCPADGKYDVNNANFGVEAKNPGSCVGGTIVASMGPDAGTGNIVAGMVPTKTLNLPDDYAYDAWGRRLEYLVDTRATAQGTCFGLKTGGLQVKTKSPTGAVVFTDNVMYAYVSHGPGGYGAWPAQGSTVANRINTGIADGDKQSNAGVNAAFVYNTTNFTNKLITKDKTAQFDDLVYYLDSDKNNCCIGSACIPSVGFQIQGENASDSAGTKVLALDLNGDGLPDYAICAPNANGTKGSVYVVFGSKTILYGAPAPFPLSSLAGTNGVRIDGNNGDHLCSSLAAGDVNGDNIQDLIIGASGANGGTGAVYVIFGDIRPWPANCSVSGLAGSGGGGGPCTNGFAVLGESVGDKFGFSVASGDGNGDDFDDLLVGAPGAKSGGGGSVNDGDAYLVCGGAGPWGATEPASGLAGIPGAVPACGVKITSSVAGGEQFGYSTAMGSVKGDYFKDLIIGAPYATAGGKAAAGKAYVICGSAGPYTTPLDATLLTGIPGAPGVCGYTLTGANTNFHTGSSVDTGDIKGSGISGVVVGAPDANPGGLAAAGSAYFVYGAASAPATLALNSLAATSTGFRVDGSTAGIKLGTSVAVGNIIGNGVKDLIIGAPLASPNSVSNAGSIYVLYGGGTFNSANPVSGFDGKNGLEIDGALAGETAGSHLSAADFNNFGLDNLLIGAPNATIGSNAGAGAADVLLANQSWPLNGVAKISLDPVEDPPASGGPTCSFINPNAGNEFSPEIYGSGFTGADQIHITGATPPDIDSSYFDVQTDGSILVHGLNGITAANGYVSYITVHTPSGWSPPSLNCKFTWGGGGSVPTCNSVSPQSGNNVSLIIIGTGFLHATDVFLDNGADPSDEPYPGGFAIMSDGELEVTGSGTNDFGPGHTSHITIKNASGTSATNSSCVFNY